MTASNCKKQEKKKSMKERKKKERNTYIKKAYKENGRGTQQVNLKN